MTGETIGTRAIGPKDILQHMAVPGWSGFYVLGCFEQRVTLYSQQVRALNLVWSLHEEQQLAAGTRVAVIGGGAAGLMAAAGAAWLGASVTMLEKQQSSLSLQRGCAKRWLHPHIYDWPCIGAVERDARLPLLNWQAGWAIRAAAPTPVASDERTSFPSAPKPEHITIARLPIPGEYLFGRDGELARLDACWSDPGTHVVSIVAMGGAGKSALVNAWLKRMQKDGWRGAERVFGWSFYSQGSSNTASGDTFMAEALHWFGDADPNAGSAWDKVRGSLGSSSSTRRSSCSTVWNRSRPRRELTRARFATRGSACSYANSRPAGADCA